MNKESIKLLFLKNIFLFILFGLIISSSIIYINYENNYKNIENKIIDDSEFVTNQIKLKIEYYLHNGKDSINSIITNELFKNYLTNPSETSEAISQQLFMAVMNNNDNFFQLRFLDAKGIEKIRIDRNKNSLEIFVIQKDKLQDKSKRYYFTETIKKNKDDFYYSDLDLNIENNELEIPIRPTLRIAKNVYVNDKFYGIIIINNELDSLLKEMSSNKEFDTYLVDKDGYFLINPESNKNWSRYFNPNITLNDEIIKEREYNSHIINEHTYYSPLNGYFQNNQDLQLILKLKESYYNNLLSSNINSIVSIAILLLLLSLGLAITISYPTSKLYIDFNKLYNTNLKYLDIIDKYVMTMKCDVNGICIDVSKRFCEISGYSKDELVGKKSTILRNDLIEKSIYEDLWNTISKGLEWSGELKGKTKSGQLYWLSITIVPYIENDKIIGYTSVSKNITDRKIIEKVSETDALTQIYNRLKLDKQLEKEFNRYIRYKQVFSLILIDIDYFKQVNDSFGHLVGDNVLIDLSNILKNNIRSTDIIGRWGGEEFLIICPNTDINGSYRLAEELRRTVENFEFNIVKHKTISLGITEIKDSDNILTLLKRVDKNLYKSKENGRNKVSLD